LWSLYRFIWCTRAVDALHYFYSYWCSTVFFERERERRNVLYISLCVCCPQILTIQNLLLEDVDQQQSLMIFLRWHVHEDFAIKIIHYTNISYPNVLRLFSYPLMEQDNKGMIIWALRELCFDKVSWLLWWPHFRVYVYPFLEFLVWVILDNELMVTIVCFLFLLPYQKFTTIMNFVFLKLFAVLSLLCVQWAKDDVNNLISVGPT